MGQDASKTSGDHKYVSIPGMIRHWSGGKFIHPMGGSENPDNDTKLVIHEATHPNMRFRFVQFEGPWGYIEHVASGKVVHPQGGSSDPGNGTALVLHEARHAGALFAFDYENHLIQHRSSKYFHPEGGNVSPPNDTELVLHEDVHDGMRWVVVTVDNVETPLYM
ncbi:lectin-like [Gigantopelta aegis]|uniref:lectin-like n=1 Tax=Gigantopelta aegis TaxID=1735272 RepID=UPI001B88D6B9|nr:lectin-like [Gigantopelta aegis]